MPLAEITTFITRQEAARAVASAVVRALSLGIARRGFASFAAAGGATPRDTYRILSQTAFDWGRVAITMTDERMVAPNRPESRAAVIGRHLLSPKTQGIRFFPLWSGSANSETAAFAADDAIRPLAPFDTALLGMDENGGVAHLCGQPTLPGEAMQPRAPRLVTSTGGDGLSLTLAALCGARDLTLLIFGETKLKAFNTADERDLPVARLVRHASPRVFWAA
jgi:6-phosphogluconolactonase